MGVRLKKRVIEVGNQAIVPKEITINGHSQKPDVTQTININNVEQKKEVPTERPVIMGLINKPVKVAVHQILQNKRVRSGNGQWVETADTKPVNECKFFGNAESGKTAEEIKANKEAGALERWAKKNTGVVIDKSSKAKGATDSAADIMGNNSSPTQGSLFSNEEPPI